MEWLPLLYQLLEVCVIPLLGVATAFLVNFIKIKSKEAQDKIDNNTADKYIGMLADTISACVIATNQTYVEALKKEVEANKLKDEINGFIPSQFDNINNPLAHYYETAEEIYADTDGLVDVVVAGIGTGGTISGIGKKLKEKKNVKMVGVEPKNSPLLSLGIAGKHKIQGIGANFVPNTLDLDVVDYIETVSDDDAIRLSRELATLEGLFVGISSGAALAGAIEYIKENNLKDKVIVVILPDTGERYLSTELVYE